MPGFDGTGPLGLGPMTGGARGFCALPVSRPAYSAPYPRHPFSWMPAAFAGYPWPGWFGRPRLGLAWRKGWRGRGAWARPWAGAWW